MTTKCLCDQCKMTVEQCRAKNPTSAEKVLEEMNTFDIINLLKKRYGGEEAILDSLENVEDEVLAEQRLRQQAKER